VAGGTAAALAVVAITLASGLWRNAAADSDADAEDDEPAVRSRPRRRHDDENDDVDAPGGLFVGRVVHGVLSAKARITRWVLWICEKFAHEDDLPRAARRSGLDARVEPRWRDAPSVELPREPAMSNDEPPADDDDENEEEDDEEEVAAAPPKKRAKPAPKVTPKRGGGYDFPSINLLASPTTPPSPAGSGQPALFGRQDAKAAANATPTSHIRRRSFSRSSGRCPTMRQPQIATGASSAMEASPNNCIRISAAMAPG
jgi:hypothetical protein